jgi:GT2 family glycosyltransferase
MKDIAICIPTFERPESCQRAVDSIRQFYPDVPVYIADDSRKPGEFEGAVTYHYPFDIGVSAKRNWLIERSTEKYLFLMDDDQVFRQKNTLEVLFDTLKTTDIHICGTELIEHGNFLDYHGDINIIDQILHYVPHKCIGKDCGIVKNRYGRRFHDVQIIPNVFLAKREVFDKVRWDNRKKLAEHTDFFLQAKKHGVKVGYSPDVFLEHFRGNCPTKFYEMMRRRARQWLNQTAEEWGFHSIKPFQGEIKRIL